jgi:hypothetical protein
LPELGVVAVVDEEVVDEEVMSGKSGGSVSSGGSSSSLEVGVVLGVVKVP